MIDLGASAVILVYARILTGHLKREAQIAFQAARERYVRAHKAASEQYPLTADALGELALRRSASISWAVPWLCRVAEGRGLQDRNLQVPLLGGRTLSEAAERIRGAGRLRVDPRSPFDASVQGAVGLAIMLRLTQQLDHWHIVDIPELHYPIESLLTGLPFHAGEHAADLLADLGMETIGDMLGDLLIVYAIGKTIYNLSKVRDLGEKAQRYHREAAALERLTALLKEIQASAERLTASNAQATYDLFRRLILSEETRPLQPLFAKGETRWVALELQRASMTYFADIDTPVAGAADSDRTARPAARTRSRISWRELRPGAVAANLREIGHALRNGITFHADIRRHEAARRELEAKLPAREKGVRQVVAHRLSKGATKRWMA